jgi:NAD(P)-dependent dehydrogenase (short-subunit alcohol dehydrogenase family)
MSEPFKNLLGKAALITGGSRGIGNAVAAGLAREGARIMIAARDPAEVARARDRLCASGADAFGLAADVAEADQVKRLVSETIIRFGRIDVLVNAAGVQGPIGPLWETDPEQWRRAFNTNLFGTMLCCRAVLPHMIAASGGKIINFSGGGATGPRANFSAYAASKAAVVRMTETLAEETRAFNIGVNAIAPGVVSTRLLDAIDQAGSAAGVEHALIETLRKDPAGFVPVELPVGLAVFLASRESDGLTGRLISASHDDWQAWDKARIRELSALPWMTLRRMDRHTLSPFIAEMATPHTEPQEARKLNVTARRN